MKNFSTALAMILPLLLGGLLDAGNSRSASYSISGGTVKMGGSPASSPSYSNIGFVGAVQTPEHETGDPKEDDDDTGFRVVDRPPPGSGPNPPVDPDTGTPGDGSDKDGDDGEDPEDNPTGDPGSPPDTSDPSSPPPVPQRPKVEGRFAHQRIAGGGTLSVEVQASGTAPLAYQWYKGREKLEGISSASLVLDPLQVSDTGFYWVEVKNSLGLARSNKFKLQVVEPPQILTHPVSQTSRERERIMMEVQMAGTPPLKYQWFHNGEEVRRAIRSSLNLKARADLAGEFTVRVSNEAGTVTSNPAQVTILARPVITSHPSPVSVVVGEDAVFTVAATGRDDEGTTVSYQWYKGRKLLKGETGESLLLQAVGKKDKGAYIVHVTNQEGTVKGRPARLTILYPPEILRQPRDIVAKEGRRAVMSARVTGTRPFTYQWFKDGEPLQGATKNHIRLIPLDPSHNGAYHLVVTNPVGSSQSVTGQVSVSTAAGQLAGAGDWRASFPEWSQIEGLEGLEADVLADFDNDGIPNLLEFAFFGNPYESDPNILPSTGKVTDPGDGQSYLVLSWRESAEATGVAIRLQASSNLKDWEDVDLSGFPISKLENGTHTVTTVYIPANASPRRFFRILVSRG